MLLNGDGDLSANGGANNSDSSGSGVLLVRTASLRRVNGTSVVYRASPSLDTRILSLLGSTARRADTWSSV